ncbi:sulfatase [Candidatus Altiarchaeota archaeon]
MSKKIMHSTFMVLFFIAFLLYASGCISQSRETSENAPVQAADAGIESIKCRDCNVVLILVDALRADHLIPYGYVRRNTSPNIERFARESILFENAYSQAPSTRQSVASIFTSLYVKQHKLYKGTEFDIDDNVNVLDQHHVTLAELMRQNGYYTISIAPNYVLTSKYGFDQGFDTFLTNIIPRKANILNGIFFEFLENFTNGTYYPNDRFFTYIHYMDVHYPFQHRWDANESYVLEYGDGRLDILHEWGSKYLDFRKYVYALNSSERDKIDLSQMVSAYDASIRYTDNAIGGVIDKLKEKGIYNKTVIILIADHGESFLDHGNLYHGGIAYNEVNHVPLIAYFPETEGGKRITVNVELVDIYPTLVDYLGLGEGKDYEVSGESLMPLVTGIGRYGKEYATIGGNTEAIMYGDWKLIRIPNKNTTMLYNLASDPHERNDLSDEKIEARTRLEEKLDEFNKKISEPEFKPREVGLDNESIRKLEALGYMK